MADDNRCKHAGCGCPTAKDSDYCSAICESAENADVEEIACECGHQGCS